MLTIEDYKIKPVEKTSLALYFQGKLIDFPRIEPEQNKILWGVYPLCLPKRVRKQAEKMLTQNLRNL
jgi:hypothetical protein